MWCVATMFVCAQHQRMDGKNVLLPLELRPIDWDAVRDAFTDWQARNDHALSIGGTGDLVELVFALSAALAKRASE